LTEMIYIVGNLLRSFFSHMHWLYTLFTSLNCLLQADGSVDIQMLMQLERLLEWCCR